MRTPLARALVALCWPALLPLAAVAVWLRTSAAPLQASALWSLAPYLTLAAAVALAWRFGRGRVVFAALAIALGAEAAQRSPSPAVLQAVAVFVPLDVALFALLRERGLVTPAALSRWGVLAAQAVLVGVLSGPAGARLGDAFTRPLLDTALPSWTPLAWPAVVATSLAALVLLVRFAMTRGPLESGLLGALAAFTVALHTPPESVVFRVYLATAGAVLVLALVETTWSLAFRDQLTGLPGRRALDEALQRLTGTYTVAMVDVDHFKKFNDKYGHDAGDEVLRMVASRLARVTGGGRAFRYGGEEFTVLFPGRGLDEARPHLEDLRLSIAGGRFVIRAAGRPRKKPAKPKAARGARKEVAVTVSIGAAQRAHEAPAAVVKSADQQLYKAKKAGRNQVMP
jgi:diguanylate cyclase (GGDEF)-like protein